MSTTVKSSDRALVWERPKEDTFTDDAAAAVVALAYWDETLLSPLLETTVPEGLSSISHPVFLSLTVHLVRSLRLRIQQALQANQIPVVVPSTHPAPPPLGVPIAVSIPEGPLLPLAIAAVHCLNASAESFGFSAVLVPLQPTEGQQRLQHMLSNSRPVLTLCAADCDMELLQDAIDSVESLLLDESSNGVSPEGLVRVQTLQIVGIQELVRQAVSSVNRDKQLQAAAAELVADPARAHYSLQQLVQDLDRHLSVVVTAARHAESSQTPLETSNSDNTNYISHIVYTSGTTGVPKGCISSSNALQHYLRVKNTAHGITRDSVVLLASALAFDPCLSDILATLQARATLGLTRRDALASNLANQLQVLQITHVLCTPTLWSTMLQGGGGGGAHSLQFPALQCIALGGEPIPKQLVQAWARSEQGTSDSVSLSSSCRLYATFGVTEACVYQTMGQVFREGIVGSGQNVGVAFAGLGIKICQEGNQESLEDVKGGGCPSGVGEVVLCGAQLDERSGYLGQPELSHKFILDAATGQYCYRTGDRGYLDPATSNLFILGRIQGEDGMVKFNGVRVELGEMEAALVDDLTDDNQAPVVVDSLVVAGQGSDDYESSTASELLAYFVLGSECKRELGMLQDVPESGVLCTAGPLLALLRERCRQKARITPSAFIILPRVPLSRTGKRDRRGVPLLSDTVPLESLFGSGEHPCVPLREYGTAGAVVAVQIIDCLNLQPSQEPLLTTMATFAMLGGDSLAATRVVRALYAYHHNRRNSRFLGGEYGELDGPFKVVHLLKAENLEAYIDWLDRHNLCLSRTAASVTESAKEPIHSSENNQTVVNATDNNQDSGDVTSIQVTEGSQLYDALLQATTRGHSAIAMGLLDVGTDPNFGKHKGRLGKTSGRNVRKKVFRSSPLHLACLKGDPPLVQKLLRHGAKSNSPDASGMFPVHLAAAGEQSGENQVDPVQDCQRLECCKLLWAAGVPLTMRDGNKQTVLHMAARSGYVQLLRYTCQLWKDMYPPTHETDSNRNDGLEWRDRWYRTPVHCTCIYRLLFG